MSIKNRIIKLIKLIKNKTWRKGLIKNIVANIELEDLLKNISVKTIIDVGSNKGQFLLLTEYFFKCKKIYSFEPIKKFYIIQKKFFKYRNNISFYNFALGKKKSKKIFYITKRKDSSSFLKINEKIKKNKDYKIIKKQIIQIQTLDEIMAKKKLEDPVLLKIDVQGYELEVLKGGVKTLKKTKYIIIEISDYEIYKNQSLSYEIIKFLKKKILLLLEKINYLKLINQTLHKKIYYLLTKVLIDEQFFYIFKKTNSKN